MKKMIALLLFAALIFALAACAKKRERYVEPPTEIITMEGGGRVIYEIETEPNGEVKTDAEGKKVYRGLYDPPVTDKEGYLVTDAEGSTVKRSSTTGAPVTADHAVDSGDLGEILLSTDADSQSAVSQTGAPQTDAAGQTAAQTDGEEVTLSSGGRTEAKTEPTTTQKFEPASTAAAVGQLSQGKANKLLQILEKIDNPFEEDLVEDRFNEATESIKVYIANIKQAQKEIQADPELYTFVTKSNLEYWNYYLTQMQIKYGEYVSIYNAQKPGQKPSTSVYSSYVAFQNEYRKAMEVYYHIEEAAEKYAK